MDWSKAKTILIISFALLNVLLGYELWVSWDEQNEANVVSTQAVEELQQLLAAEQIKLEDTLPMDLQKMGYLQIEVVQNDEEWQSIWPRVAIPSGEDREAEVTEELRTHIDHLSEYTLDLLAVERREWIYYQLAGDFPIFAAPIELKREGNRLTAFRKVEVMITSRERTNTVVSPQAALKSVVEAQLISSGSTITDVRLGYTGHLGAQEPQFLIPVWRIQAAGKDPLYVNALTGGMEADNWPVD